MIRVSGQLLFVFAVSGLWPPPRRHATLCRPSVQSPGRSYWLLPPGVSSPWRRLASERREKMVAAVRVPKTQRARRELLKHTPKIVSLLCISSHPCSLSSFQNLGAALAKSIYAFHGLGVPWVSVSAEDTFQMFRFGNIFIHTRLSMRMKHCIILPVAL